MIVVAIQEAIKNTIIAIAIIIVAIPVLIGGVGVLIVVADNAAKKRKFKKECAKREAEEERDYQKAMKRKHEELDLLQRRIRVFKEGGNMP